MQCTLVLMGNCPDKSLHITLQMHSSVFKAGLLTPIMDPHSGKERKKYGAWTSITQEYSPPFSPTPPHSPTFGGVYFILYSFGFFFFFTEILPEDCMGIFFPMERHSPRPKNNCFFLGAQLKLAWNLWRGCKYSNRVFCFYFPLSFLFFLTSLHINPSYSYADSGPNSAPAELRDEWG